MTAEIFPFPFDLITTDLLLRLLTELDHARGLAKKLRPIWLHEVICDSTSDRPSQTSKLHTHGTHQIAKKKNKRPSITADESYY